MAASVAEAEAAEDAAALACRADSRDSHAAHAATPAAATVPTAPTADQMTAVSTAENLAPGAGLASHGEHDRQGCQGRDCLGQPDSAQAGSASPSREGIAGYVLPAGFGAWC